MAKAKNVSDDAVSVLVAENEISESVASNSAVRKHVALEHLYIIKEYVDKQTDKTISSAEGFHGIRYYNGKLQAKDADTGNWVNIATGNTDEGGGSGVDIADDKDVEDLFS